jgi:hypothetical protein
MKIIAVSTEIETIQAERLRVYENRVLGRIFGPMRNEKTG